MWGCGSRATGPERTMMHQEERKQQLEWQACEHTNKAIPVVNCDDFE